jgi:hypothetical protein
VAEDATVWMIHARTGIQGMPGELSLEGDRLVFRPIGGRSATTVIPLSEVKGVRRARGSPVLEVRPGGSRLPPVVGFYFVKPPSLEPPANSFPVFSRYLAKRRAITALRGGNAARGKEVDRWVERLREAMA